jgi:hypothetical protein
MEEYYKFRKGGGQPSGAAGTPVDARLAAVAGIEDDALFAQALRELAGELQAADGEAGHRVTHEGRHLFIPDGGKGGANNSTFAGKKSILHKENEPRTEPKDNPAGPGRVKGSIESAAHDTGGGAESSPGHDASFGERGSRVSGEQKRLKTWAEENGKLGGKLPREDTRGGEHTVQSDHEKGLVYKATRPEMNLGYLWP